MDDDGGGGRCPAHGYVTRGLEGVLVDFIFESIADVENLLVEGWEIRR